MPSSRCYHHAVVVDDFLARHLERDRAESFGSVAEQYDRYRPAFPDALLDDLAAMTGPTPVLDVGCGTGKVARGLARRGLPVLGVELDPRMAEVARGQGVPVEIARFEEWDDAGRRFDLLTCGDAWHWIEPSRGAEKVSQVLRPGGAFARFWNIQLLDEPVMAALDVVYEKYAPEVFVIGRVPPYELPAALRSDDPRAGRHDRRVRAPRLTRRNRAGEPVGRGVPVCATAGHREHGGATARSTSP